MKRFLSAFLLTLCAAFPAFADLTQPQRVTLKAAILADPVMAALAAQGAPAAIAEALNTNADPVFVVWKTNVSVDEIMRNGMDWARVDNLSVGKARIWEWMGRLGAFNCARPNIRSGIDATWAGTAADLTVRATVYTHCKRPATKLEKVFATGTGTDADPATMTVEGRIEWPDVQAALGS